MSLVPSEDWPPRHPDEASTDVGADTDPPQEFGLFVGLFFAILLTFGAAALVVAAYGVVMLVRTL